MDHYVRAYDPVNDIEEWHGLVAAVARMAENERSQDETIDSG
jgi:hypothetical protein